jgi:hypothetical protein
MPRNNFAKLLLVVVLTFSAQLASAFTLTVYQVGKCRPVRKFPAYNSISAALAANPAPDAVEVCPGTYYEQIEITRPVILVGISSGNAGQVIIAPPAGGLVTNTSDEYGNQIAAQIWVNNAVGPVTITDITVDGAGNGVTSFTVVAGIFYQNSPGTVNRVEARNQQNYYTQGMGILVDGGASNPSVTIENSSFRDSDYSGIKIETNSSPSNVTAFIKGNYSKPVGYGSGIYIRDATATITNNYISDAYSGIYTTGGATGSISGNTLMDSQFGIDVSTSAVPVTSNKIFNSSEEGISFRSATAAIQGNTIVDSFVGIEFSCIANGNVNGNTIIDAGTALDMVPLATSSSNSYSNVATIRTGCP